MASLDDMDCVACPARFARARKPRPRADAGRMGLCAHFLLLHEALERENQMMKAATARQREFTPEQDDARWELARGLPPPLDWQIGRASCRERREIMGEAAADKTK